MEANDWTVLAVLALTITMGIKEVVSPIVKSFTGKNDVDEIKQLANSVSVTLQTIAKTMSDSASSLHGVDANRKAIDDLQKAVRDHERRCGEDREARAIQLTRLETVLTQIKDELTGGKHG